MSYILYDICHIPPKTIDIYCVIVYIMYVNETKEIEMTTNKRQINGAKYEISEIVDNAIAAVDAGELDLVSARKSLEFYGNKNPGDELVIKFARETAILKILSRETGANFNNQIGKIDFSSRDQAIAGVNSYLNRRISGQHARWSDRRK